MKKRTAPSNTKTPQELTALVAAVNGIGLDIGSYTRVKDGIRMTVYL